MKIELPEIYWHGNRERIMSIDFGPANELVTGGADLASGVYLRLWRIFILPEVKVEHIEDLAGTHERSVNIVRYSPCKNFIASGSDDSCVVIWEKKKKPVFGEDRFEIGWGSKKVLRGHLREIHDLCWSKCGRYVASGSLDGCVIIFDVDKGKVNQRLEGSKPIHGVAWCGEILASLSTDRSLRIYEKGKKGFYIKHCIKEIDGAKIFQDEATSSAYFRKLAFSIDGNFLLTTAGVAKGVPVVHCFFNENYSGPSLAYPVNITKNAASLAIRFCPVTFKSQKSDVFKAYESKVVWAVACKDSVIIYSSDQDAPLAAVTNAHYSSITDIAWLNESLVAVCSIDGYVSFICFENGELGEKVESPNEGSTQDMEVDNESSNHGLAELEIQMNKVVVDNHGKKRIVPQMI